MDNPGALQLTQNGSAFPIVGPGTFIGDAIEGLEGMKSLSLQAQFLYGSGGASVLAYIQTSLDQGQTWFDIAALQFETSSGTQIINLSADDANTTPFTPSQQSLPAGTCINGVLGDRLRAVVVVTGTYGASSLLNLAGCAR